MRAHVRAKFVAAKKRVSGKKRVAFTFEILVGRQPDDFEVVLLHPIGEEWRLAGSFLVPEIAGNEFLSHRESGVRREDHVREFGPGWNQVNVATQTHQFLV